MTILVHDCPRCGAAEMTFDVTSDTFLEERHGWQRIHEAFALCRVCHVSTVFTLAQRESFHPTDSRFQRRPSDYGEVALNDYFRVEGYIAIKDMATAAAPEHCPAEVEAAFREGATCLAVGCHNAAGAMFRLCVDLTTRPMLPASDAPDGPNARTRRDLGLRLQWLFDEQEFHQLLDKDGVADDIHLFNDKLREWEDYYNYHRPHGALDGQTPYERLLAKTTASLSPAS
jgi:hypothetical protein